MDGFNAFEQGSEDVSQNKPEIVRWLVTVVNTGIEGETREFTSVEDKNEFIAATLADNPDTKFIERETTEPLTKE